MDEVEIKKLRDKIDENFDHYESILKAEFYDGYEDTEDFIGSVSDEHLAELLHASINGKDAFLRFKDILEQYPEERENWFHFKDNKLKQRALRVT